MQSMLCPSVSDPETRSDIELIASALQGDESGYVGLAERYESRLHGSILALVGCPVIAEEVVQESLTKAFMHLSTFRGDSGFYTWIYRIALNSRPRTTASAKLVSFDSGSELIQSARTNRRESPAVIAERREDRKRVREALGRLNPKQRSVILLYEFDGLDYKAIAARLGISIGTVRSRLSRARAELRQELATYFYEAMQSGRPSNPR